MYANLVQFDSKQVLLCLNIDTLNYLLLNWVFPLAHYFHFNSIYLESYLLHIFIARYSYGWWGAKTSAAQDPETGRPVLLLPAGDHEAALRVPGLPDTGGQSGGLQLAQVGDGSKRILKLWCIVIYDCFVGRSQSMVPGLVMELLVLRPLQSQSKRFKLIIEYCRVTLHQHTSEEI